MSNDNQNTQIVQQPSQLQLSIPHATTLTQVEKKNSEVTRSELVKQQGQVIEKAFAELPKNQVEVNVEFDKPLTSELWNALSERGYNIYQSMSYDSRDTANHSGKYKVSITPNEKHDWEGHKLLRDVEKDMSRLRKSLYRPYFMPLTFPYPLLSYW